LALAALVLCCCGDATAQPEDAGKFEALHAEDKLVDGVYQVTGEIYLRLPSEAVRALEATVPLTVRVEVQFLNRLWFWWDHAQFERVVRYLLSYNSLANRFVVDVEPPEPGEGGNFGGTYAAAGRLTFPTLDAALEHIGTIENLAVVEASKLDRNLRYDIRIRAVLDRDELPGPLWLLFWRDDGSISSEWLTWRLDAE
jgi:hypothetical protein